ncbi:helix-turn-helix transcriptional regulator [Pseudonocardia alni]|uniref:helix-turn-helix transcriptional regulator n=1 Tax=Pseudonocardia alni TaxID=33907 RepID=UPI0033FAAFC7
MVTTGSVTVRGPADAATTRRWHEVCRSNRLADSVWVPGGRSTFRGSVRRHTVHDLTVLDLDTDPFGSRFRPDSEMSGLVGFAVHDEPFVEHVVFDDASRRTAHARYSYWDYATLVETEILTPARLTMVIVPRSALHRTPAPADRVREGLAEQDGPVPRLLGRLVLAAAAEAPRMNAAAAVATRAAILELLSAAVRTEVTATTSVAVSDAMRVSVGRWVDERLHLGPPSAAEVAAAHGISVRSLHRLFAGTGDTFGSTVRRRRLDRARRDLATTEDLVQTIAMRWGYSDASHFIHEFRRALGVTPAEFRRRSTAVDTPSRVPPSRVPRPRTG